MNAIPSTIKKPQRWAEPFGEPMPEEILHNLLAVPPFSSMDASRFPKSTPLDGIIQNDCRLLELKAGDIIVREGDYGSSAFLIIGGEALVALKSLPPELLGRDNRKRKSFFQALSQFWTNDKQAEVRRYDSSKQQLNQRRDGEDTRVFLQDVPRVIAPDQSVSLVAGEIFGEISALTRTPRSATVVANTDMFVLEIRWQGLRDLMNSDPALKEHVEQAYRDNSLKSHLRELDLFSSLTTEQISQVAEKTEFETYGKFQWNVDYQKTSGKDVANRILDEPLIVQQGEYVNGLLLVRNGFVRICRQHGNGIQTVAYKGKGGVFGLREIARNWKSETQHPWALSLRAVGYVDLLRIPVECIEPVSYTHLTLPTKA